MNSGNPDFFLFSDGGSVNANGAAAAACIVEDAVTAEIVRFIGYLGRATNNEAEIVGGLLGFSFLSVIPDRQRMESCIVRWTCDSEYVLKSATGYIRAWQKNGWRTAARSPVKNQGLWRAFLELTGTLHIIPQHVRGHSGHPENEACDSAIQWAKAHAGELLANGGSPPATVALDGESWTVLDLRSAIQTLRIDTPPPSAVSTLANLFRSPGLNSFGDSPRPAGDPLHPVLSRLREASLLAENLRGETAAAEKLAKAIRTVLRQFEE